MFLIKRGLIFHFVVNCRITFKKKKRGSGKRNSYDSHTSYPSYSSIFTIGATRLTQVA
jgi:putative flippase GtrA